MAVLNVLDTVTANLALLHAGGWDELIMVAIGLAVAWAVIAFTGRRNEEADEELADEPTEGGDL
jgi:hypothetical protein